MIILVVTVTGQGDNPRHTHVFSLPLEVFLLGFVLANGKIIIDSVLVCLFSAVCM